MWRGMSLGLAGRSWRLGILACILTCGCLHIQRTEPAPLPAQLPRHMLRAYRPQHPGFAQVVEPGEERGRCHESYAVSFWTYSEIEGDFKRVEGRLYRSLRVPSGKRGPLILIAPILAGAVDNYLACRVFARWACQEGNSAFYLHQEENILSDERDGVELERLLRDSIQDNIKALDLLAERQDVDSDRLGSLGISMGAIKNVVLAAVEPRLEANVFCLAGGDLPRIFLASREKRVVQYLRRRETRDELTREQIGAEIGRCLEAEPLRFAPSIPNDRSLLFLGALDNKVPYETGLALGKSLGEPEIFIIPLGPYTGILAAPFAAREMFGFFHRRFEALEGGEHEGSPRAPSP